MTTHPRGPWTITLNYARPPKGLSANDSVNPYVKGRHVKQIREEMFWRVRAAKIPALERIRVALVWVVTDARNRDGGENLAPFLKAIIDGIASNRGISARIVDDDDPAHVERIMPTIRLDRDGVAHFEVTITNLGDA